MTRIYYAYTEKRREYGGEEYIIKKDLVVGTDKEEMETRAENLKEKNGSVKTGNVKETGDIMDRLKGGDFL